MGADGSEYADWLAKQRAPYPPFKSPITSRALLRCAAAAVTGRERDVKSVAKRTKIPLDSLTQVATGARKLSDGEKTTLLKIRGVRQQLWIHYYSRRAATGRGSLFDGKPS